MRVTPPIALQPVPGSRLLQAAGGVVEIVAAGALVEVAAVGRGVAQLGAGAGQDGRGEQRVACHDTRVVGGLGVGERARRGAGRRRRVSSIVLERQAADVDHVQRALDVFFQQVDQVGAAGEEARRRSAALANGLGDLGRTGVVEADHLPAPSVASTSTIGVGDVGVGAAAAEVAAHQLAHLVARHGVAFGDQRAGRAELARRAVAALERVVVHEGLLQRVEPTVAAEAFDRSSPRSRRR